MQRLDEGRLVLRFGGQPADLLVALVDIFIVLLDHQRVLFGEGAVCRPEVWKHQSRTYVNQKITQKNGTRHRFAYVDHRHSTHSWFRHGTPSQHSTAQHSTVTAQSAPVMQYEASIREMYR